VPRLRSGKKILLHRILFGDFLGIFHHSITALRRAIDLSAPQEGYWGEGMKAESEKTKPNFYGHKRREKRAEWIGFISVRT
jgi:hypothetical protein